jgi:type VI secretion system secreted protein Hcp
MAVDMFLKLDGIKGESVDLGHKDEIEILSFSWGVNQQGSHGGGGGGGAGKVSMSDISFSHTYDKASPVLMSSCCSGKHIPQATLSVRKAGSTQDYLKYKLSDLLISSYQLQGNSGEAPTENVSINFSKVEITYYAQDGRGTVENETAACGGKQGKAGRTR